MGLLDILLGTTASKDKQKIKVGDRVYIPWTGQTGYVIDITGNLCQVSITKENGTDIVKTYSIDQVKLAKGII